MKTIIAGSRTVRTYSLVVAAIGESAFTITEVVCGMAPGPDLMGMHWAMRQTPAIPVKKFPAHWNSLGRRAGFVRNSKMADYAEALVAVWDGKSSGTRHMIEEARKRGLQVYVKEVKP